MPNKLKGFTEFVNESERTFDVSQARIFQDMDGCLTNYDKKFSELAGNDDMTMDEYEATHGKGAAWSLVETGGKEFWSTMEWMPDGKELWDYVTKYPNTTILTSPSRDPNCYRGKWEWIKRELPEVTQSRYTSKAEDGNWDKNTKAIINNHKHLFCANPNWILIDDTQKKIDKWREAGGVGILHTDTKTTIEKLKELGL